MTPKLDHTSLHRTAKYFMDNGTASSHDEALDLLKSFGLTIYVGDEIAESVCHQNALLTLVNVARRTFLGGVEVVGSLLMESVSPLAPNCTLDCAVKRLGGIVVSSSAKTWPAAVIGSAEVPQLSPVCLQLTWAGWSGGVVPAKDKFRLDEAHAMSIAPALAAAVCAAELFSYFAGDNPLAGRRSSGLSLWNLSRDWLEGDEVEPELTYLPSRLWLIGLGNLGQAYAWLLACLPFSDPGRTELLLQDFDLIAQSNDSTSVLSFREDVGRRKARCVAGWLEARGFTTVIEERRFGGHTRRANAEPSVALCGVDNALARMSLGSAGFDLVVEAGLGAGPNAFRSVSMHTFPATRTPEQIWARHLGPKTANFESQPAYRTLRAKGMDACGLTQLASRTVGVPFVGIIAGCLVVSELLRRLNGGPCLEQASGNVSALRDFEVTALPQAVYPGSYELAGTREAEPSPSMPALPHHPVGAFVEKADDRRSSNC